MSKDKNFPFEQLFIRPATGDSPEQFVCMSYKESPPLKQIGDACDTIETTECFYELCGPWGLIMRKYVDEYEKKDYPTDRYNKVSRVENIGRMFTV